MSDDRDDKARRGGRRASWFNKQSINIHECRLVRAWGPSYGTARLANGYVEALFAFALPHLPPPLPALITNGLKYMQIGGVFLDDISALLVGMGFFIWVACWVACWVAT